MNSQMNHHEYKLRLDNAFQLASGSNASWNLRFLMALNILGLELKPIDYKDPLNRGRDCRAPIPLKNQVTWSDSIIGVME